MANAREFRMEQFSRRQPTTGTGCIHAVGTEKRARAQPRTTQANMSQRKVERAMGIEPMGKALPEVENKRFCANADAKCD